MNSETKAYLEDLFATKADSDYILIWSKQGEKSKSANLSRWAQTVDEALKAVAAAESESGWHIYAGVCPRPKAFGPHGRGLIGDCSALLAFWVDIDIGELGHKSKRNPQNEAQALALVDKFGLPATMTVHTGGGIHAYWLLNEAWQFANDTDRADASQAMQAFQKVLQIHAAAAGFAIDPTFDLTRVLRVPGTTNWKGDIPRQCRLLPTLTGSVAPRYDLSDIKERIPPEAYQPASAKAQVSKQIGGLVLSPDAMPPQDKFEALRLADPKFELSVKYQRRDFPKGDFTPSSYDMSLAATAAYAEWTEQEIADLMIFVRRLHNQDLRIDDARYYVRTINIAIADAQRKRAMDDLRGSAATAKILDSKPAQADAAPIDPEEKRNRTLAAISRALGCRIRGVVKYAQDPPRYRLLTGNGGIELGTVDMLIGQPQIRNALAAVDGHMLPKFNTADWEAIAQMLLDCCKVISTGPESTAIGAIREWLNVYFDDNPVGELSAQSIANQQPHIEGEYIVFYLSHFQTWLYQRRQQNKSPQQLGIMLRLVKAKIGTVTYHPEGGKRTTRSAWYVPKPESNGEAVSAPP